MSNSKRRTRASLVSNGRWAAYAAAGAASALAAHDRAEADITHVVVNQIVNGGAGTAVATFYMGPASSGYLAFVHFGDGSAGAGFFGAGGSATGGVAGFTANGGFGNFPYVSNVAYGANVSTLSFAISFGTLGYYSGVPFSQFSNPGIAYVAFRFDGGGGTQYGWAQLNVTGNPDNSFTVIDFAYGGIGEAITVGQVPEPGSMALLALGAAGIAGWRRKRARAA